MCIHSADLLDLKDESIIIINKSNNFYKCCVTTLIILFKQLVEYFPPSFQLETSTSNTHEQLNTIVDYQTHHRLMEAQGRKRAEDLNHRVMYYSFGEAILIVIIGIGEVMVLKSFFSEKKSSST